ncbi:MAG: VOC family protein [Prochloraceae cyanobacterium]
MSDLGLTHIALEVTNIDKSISFYEKYAGMKVVHRRVDKTTDVEVVWISDLSRPFAIVLMGATEVNGKLSPQSHLGVACESRAEIDRLCSLARLEGILLKGPLDLGDPVGYLALIADPDGHTLEISYGQKVKLTIENYEQ